MRIGAYEVLRELGRGGMGAVYLARALGPGGVQRLVAIKRPHALRAPASDAERAEIAERFIEEARITAQVHHANVVGMHQAGTDDEGHYLVFDYVEGESLGELVERARSSREQLPAAIAARIVLDALAGLHAAHETRGPGGEALGILHRDVSPQNLLVGRDGVTRLTDFGIARTAETAFITDQRYVRGKFAFMSPEYLQRLPVDRTMDVYAMGVTLYIALHGSGPWPSCDDAQLMQAILVEGVPRLTAAPQPLADVVATACRMDAGQRYQTARQMLEALTGACESAGLRATHFDVAEYVERVAGADLNARRDAIASVPAPRVEARPSPAPSPARPDSTELHWQREEPVAAGPGPDTGELLRSIEPPARRSWLAYGALAAVAVGGAFFVMNRGRAGSVPPAPPRSAVAASAQGQRVAPPPVTTEMDAGTGAPAAERSETVPVQSVRAAPPSRRPPTSKARSPSAGSGTPFLPFSPSNPYK